MDVPLLDLMKDDTGYDRTFKRYRVSFPMLVQAAAEETGETSLAPESDESLPGLAHNISLSGTGFVCAGAFNLASLVKIEITLEAQTYLLLARIHRRRQLDLPGDPLYYYGAQFLRTEAVLQFIPAAAEFLLAQSSERSAGRSNGMTPGSAPREQMGRQGTRL